MDTYSISKDSWHYRFNRFWITNIIMPVIRSKMEYTPEIVDKYIQMNRDFCSYWRFTVAHIFSAVYLAFILLGIAVGLGFILYFVGIFLVKDFMIGLYTLLFVLLAAIVLILVGALMTWLAETFYSFVLKFKSKSNKSVEQKPREPGFFATRYRTWKDRTCMKIDFQ